MQRLDYKYQNIFDRILIFMTKKHLFCGSFFPFSAPSEIRLYNFYYFLKRLLYLHPRIKQDITGYEYKSQAYTSPIKVREILFLDDAKKNITLMWCLLVLLRSELEFCWGQGVGPQDMQSDSPALGILLCTMTGTMNYESHIYSIGHSINRKTNCYSLLGSETFHVWVQVNW